MKEVIKKVIEAGIMAPLGNGRKSPAFQASILLERDLFKHCALKVANRCQCLKTLDTAQIRI